MAEFELPEQKIIFPDLPYDKIRVSLGGENVDMTYENSIAYTHSEYYRDVDNIQIMNDDGEVGTIYRGLMKDKPFFIKTIRTMIFNDYPQYHVAKPEDDTIMDYLRRRKKSILTIIDEVTVPDDINGLYGENDGGDCE